MENKVYTAKTLSCEEAKTRALFATVDHTRAAQLISDVFCAFPASTFSCHKLEAVVYALHNVEINLQNTLTQLVKARVLRSRKSAAGTTIYEVNF